MYFVYIIKSDKDGSYYVGTTMDVNNRLREHNSGSSKYSSSKIPFQLIWYCGFNDKKKAYEFERYLKAGSGVAFRNKRLI
jgi:predicted GIY-YIG superfamily endonuclease